MLFLAAYLIVMFGRLPEVAAQFTGSGLLLSPMTMAAVVITTVLSGGWKRAVGSVPGALWILFSLWILGCTPFSAWPGGSFEFLRTTVWKYLLIYYVTAGLIQSRQDLRRAMYSLGVASIAILLMATFLGQNATQDQRFEVGFGTFRNSNDLATALLVTSPFLLLFAMNQKGLSFLRIGATVLLIASLVTVLKTGSRGALVCTLVIVAYTFWQASMSTKIKLAPALLLGAVLFFLLLPAPVFNRYATLLHLGGGANAEATEFTDQSAIESAQIRKEMLALSIQLTLEHPLLGVGPGAFVYAADEEFKSRGERSLWLESHNSYTQISSETGLIGLLLYCSLLAYSFWNAYLLYRRTRNRPELAEANAYSFCLLLAVFSYVVCSTFSSIGYMGYLPLLSALTLATVRATADLLPARGGYNRLRPMTPQVVAPPASPTAAESFAAPPSAAVKGANWIRPQVR